MRNVVRLLCAVLLCGAVAVPASAQYLTADEIKRLFAGTSVETYFWNFALALGNSIGDFPLRINLKPDGSLEGTVEYAGP